MPDTLHILNGDSTLSIFENSSVQGDVFVWREVLSEGPVHPEFATEEFWQWRDEFMTQYFSLEKGQYQKEIVAPFKSLQRKIKNYKEVTLWFEYDLFCQINMMTLIHWLNEVKSTGQTISMVCSGKVEGSEALLGLSELNLEQLEDHYKNRLKLNRREFTFASDVYQAYTSEELSDLFTFVLMPSDEFIYIADAISTHLKRFPSKATGLTEIEAIMLHFIQQGVKDDGKLVEKMLQWQNYYGFGDLQYLKKLNNLKVLFEDFDQLRLKSEPALSTAIRDLNRSYYLGGVKVSDWVYNEENQEVEQITS